MVEIGHRQLVQIHYSVRVDGRAVCPSLVDLIQIGFCVGSRCGIDLEQNCELLCC